MALIEVDNLSMIYRDDETETVGLAGVSFVINEGEYVAVIGPSGSGKSTLLQILGALDRPTGGKYYFEKKEIGKYSDDELAQVRNEKMGFVFQSFNLLARQSVVENVKLPLVYGAYSESERMQRADEMVKLVGLENRRDFKVNKLSGGQKQRVAIARALINRPKVIFADEPTGSLDSHSGEAILDFIDELHKKGNTIIMVTHESYVAERASRILHIKDGLIDRDELIKDKHTVSRGQILK